MKNVLKVFVLVLVVFCMVVSCSKKADGSSGSSGGNSNDTDGGGSTAAGSSSAVAGSGSAAVSSDNSLKNAVGKIEHGKDDTIFNSWAEIEWAAFGLSAAPAEPSGGKLEAAYIIKNGYPYIFLSNISRAAYEKLCREMEAEYNKEGEIYDSSWDNVSYGFGLVDCDERFDIYNIPVGATHETVELHLGDDSGNDIRVYENYELTIVYTLSIYYYDSPLNGVIMTLFSESIM